MFSIEYSAICILFQLIFGYLGSGEEDGLEELLVSIIDNILEDIFFFLCGLSGDGSNIFMGAAFDDFGYNLEIFEELADINFGHNDTDAAGDGSGLCEDMIGGTSDIVGAGCGDISEDGDDGFFGFLFKLEDFLIDGLGCGDCSASGVNLKDKGFDVFIFGGLVDGL